MQRTDQVYATDRYVYAMDSSLFFVSFSAVRAEFPRHLSKFEQLRGFTRMSPLESPCGGALHVIGPFPGFKRLYSMVAGRTCPRDTFLGVLCSRVRV